MDPHSPNSVAPDDFISYYISAINGNFEGLEVGCWGVTDVAFKRLIVNPLAAILTIFEVSLISASTLHIKFRRSSLALRCECFFKEIRSLETQTVLTLTFAGKK